MIDVDTDDVVLKDILRDQYYSLNVSPSFTDKVMRRVWIRTLAPWFGLVIAAVVFSVSIFTIELFRSGILDSIRASVLGFDFSWRYVLFLPRYFYGIGFENALLILLSLFMSAFSFQLFKKTVFAWIRTSTSQYRR